MTSVPVEASARDFPSALSVSVWLVVAVVSCYPLGPRKLHDWPGPCVATVPATV